MAALEYTVSMERANTHYFEVSLKIRSRKAIDHPMRLMMPVWTPGHYLIEDFPRNVLDVKAWKKGSGDSRREASVEKEGKNVWIVNWSGSTDFIEVRYQVFAFEHHHTKSYLDTVHAIINGASVFIYPIGMEKSPITLRLLPYVGWKRVATGLEQSSSWKFLAPDIDNLIDSPIEVGNQEVRSFFVQGVRHEVSLFGDAPIDKRKLVDDIKKIVEGEVSVFGQIPYKKYVFIVNFTNEAGGGLEHQNSTICFVPRLRLIPSEEYNLMMGLFSHEFFHAWNVKRLRPLGLGPFDYSAEAYTKSLWIAEGITSYYDDLILRRVGLCTVPEYLDAFVTNVNMMKSLAGSKWQSAQESSYDAWIKHYKADSNSPNVSMSYYTQGAVIGWMLDLQIMKNTHGLRNLDVAMRKIYERTYVKEGRGYSDEEFESVVMKAGGGRGLREIFDSRVRGREEVDFDLYLDYVGLRLEPVDNLGAARGFLGVRIDNEGGKITVKNRIAGSPAELMGLSVSDELVGIDGLRFGLDKFAFYVSNKQPGSPVEILLARDGVLMQLSGKIGRKPPFEYRITPLKVASNEQKFLFKRWLSEEWKPEIKYPNYSKSPDRKKVLDYI